MTPSTLGLLIGLALGFAGAFGGFGAFLVVGLLGLIGFVAGKVLEGQLDLSGLLGGDRRR
ncbi:hypothetical protein GB931_01605 [Modestobacter sp. I12A-02628]|uniref:DUF2273 domain-containing protein n=1 Tax=Goekera deserti TaxID=2497753 RepID=A0A7K3WIG8_9ACTN|nr:hypothetical protein [Goekera deserti]MPQ96636.1 hypothetical protein [Goekera deserti]NDI47052.1 hypothetical protein [Goekera deserti]NEL56288.1 hypothetical protein [Goekera deserti]